MLFENWQSMTNILFPVIKTKSEQEKRLELVTGGIIEFWSLDNPDAPRGRKYHHVSINEAAMVRDLSNAWNSVIRPMLADYRGSADFGSTPRGLNYFHILYQQAEHTDGWARWQRATSNNPFIASDEIESVRVSLPERVYQQEFLAEFITDGAYFQGVDQAATIQHPSTPEEHRGHFITGGIDFALSHDYTVITLGCRDCNRVVDWDRFNQMDFNYQRERIINMVQRWGAVNILPERNSVGEPNIEILRERVSIGWGDDRKPGFNTTATTKPALIQRLASALVHDHFQIPAEYADELRSYEVATMATGHPKFSAPSGSYDDRVMSLALCWWALTSAISPYSLIDGV
jgi:hypothetical protein